MRLVNLVVLIFAVVPAYINGQQVTCSKQINNCKCETTSGKFIDLSPLAAVGDFKFKKILGPNKNWVYSYNPCNGVRCETQSNAATCQNGASGAAEFLLGQQDTAKFGFDSTYGLYIKYDNKQSGGVIRESMISLVCRPNGQDEFLPTDDGGVVSPYIFHSRLTSKYACEVGGGGGGGGDDGGGMSGGDILIIIVLVLVAVYLAGGFAINVLLLKTGVGVQALPNLTFWVAVPGYIKDGAVFTVVKVRGLVSGRKQGYDNV